MGIFDKIRNGLAKTRDQFLTRIEWAVKGKPIDEDAFDEIEEAMILADVGFETTQTFMAALKERWKRGYIKTSEEGRGRGAPQACGGLNPHEQHKTICHFNPWGQRGW